MSVDTHERGYTVSDAARYFRVARSKIRAWIRSGRLGAVNVAAPLARPRYVVLPRHLEEFERRNEATPPAKPARRPKRTEWVDYFPD